MRAYELKWQPGQPLYHVTNHPDAERTGLEPKEQENVFRGIEAGIYLSPEPEAYNDYGQCVYEVNVDGLPVQEDPEHWGESYVVTVPISPDRIKRA